FPVESFKKQRDLCCDNLLYLTAVLTFGNLDIKIGRGKTRAWTIFICISLNKADCIVFSFLIWFCGIIRIAPLGYQGLSKNTSENRRNIKTAGYFSSIIKKYSYTILLKWIVTNNIFSQISEFPALVY